MVFPKAPLMRVEGPLAVCQLLETTLLNLVNFPSLIATNAARMRLVAGPNKILLEYGLRRAQGPDGALSASKYAYLGGFDGTSNVLAGKLYGMSVKGTHAHSFVMSYSSIDELNKTTIASANDPAIEVEFVRLVLQKREQMDKMSTNEGELAAFIAYAQSSPRAFLALVDTYDTIQSGIPNFLCVGWALYELGYLPLGIRLDSGDLAYLSIAARAIFTATDESFVVPNASVNAEGVFRKCRIMASNDINEDVLLALQQQGHEIDAFGIGTHLVTCQKQPALGCVFKLVEVNGKPRIKLSNDIEKTVIPGKKTTYRMYGADGHCLVDVMMQHSEEAPTAGKKMLIRHPFIENKRAHVTPARVKALLVLAFDGENGGIQPLQRVSLEEARERCLVDLSLMRQDHIRALNPTPYKVSVSQSLYDYTHKLWLQEAPVVDLK